MEVQHCNLTRNALRRQWHGEVQFNERLQTPKEGLTACGRRVARFRPRLKGYPALSFSEFTVTIMNCKESVEQLIKIFESPYLWTSDFRLHLSGNRLIVRGSLPFLSEDLRAVRNFKGVADVDWEERDERVIEVKLDKEVDPNDIIEAIDAWMKL